MKANEAAAYLSKLLNREVTVDAAVTLTSGQRARFLSWLEHSGVDADLARTRIVATRPFTLGLLAGPDITEETRRPSVQGSDAVRGSYEAGTAAESGGTSDGVGIDIQRVAEIVPFPDSYDFRSSPELAEIFSGREIAYACGRPSPTQTLAGLFAAKEAIIKADPAKGALKLREIEILPGDSGAPFHRGFRVSISHSGDYAVAMAMKMPAAASFPRPPAPK